MKKAAQAYLGNGGVDGNRKNSAITGDHSKYGLRYKQKPIYLPTFTNNIWSYLLWSPAIAQRDETNDRASHDLAFLFIVAQKPASLLVIIHDGTTGTGSAGRKAWEGLTERTSRLLSRPSVAKQRT